MSEAAIKMMEPDRDQLEIFVNALFRHAGTGGYVSLRAFFAQQQVDEASAHRGAQRQRFAD
jgi:hypothetical protein